MSDIKYKLYQESVLRLTDSLIIKNEALISLMNRSLKYKGVPVDKDDPYSWKFYKNIAGQYHHTDTPMTVTSLDTMEQIDFTTANLLIHRATAKEYYKGSEYYEALVRAYPLQEDLIRGIIAPIDMKTAIEAPDYTILYHSKKELERQEDNLMHELQNWLYTSADRWITKDYAMVDDLYPVTTYMNLLMLIPSIIMTIRSENCNTFKAHSFHVWNWLESHGHLYKYKRYLTIDQILWLYRNIGWVFENAGKKETFEKLMDVILTRRGLPLGSYFVRHNVEEINTRFMPEPEAVRIPLNEYAKSSNKEIIRSLRFLMEKSLNHAVDNGKVMEDDIITANQKFSETAINELPTKVYESDVIDRANAQPYKLGDVLLNHWLYFSTNGYYNAVVNIRNPYTNEIMTMTTSEAFLVWMYALNKARGFTMTDIPTLVANFVRINPLPKFPALRKLVPKSAVDDEDIDWYLDNQAVIGSMISTEAFNDTCTEIFQMKLLHRKYFATQDSRERRMWMEALATKFYTCKEVKFFDHDYTFQQFFFDKGWYIEELIRSDLELLVTDIYNTTLGIDVGNTRTLKEIQRSLLQLMSQLGTYDTQYLQTINDQPATILDLQSVRLADPTRAIGSTMKVYNVAADTKDIKVQTATLIDMQNKFDVAQEKPEFSAVDSYHMELPNLMHSRPEVQIYVRAQLSEMRHKWTGFGNAGDFEIDGDLTDIVIRPIDGTDLETALPVRNLHGLFYVDSLGSVITVTQLNGLKYNTGKQ